MRMRARVSSEGVSGFRNAAADLQHFAGQYEGALACLEGLRRSIAERIVRLQESMTVLEKSRAAADCKRCSIVERIARLIEKRESVHAELSLLKYQTASMSPVHTCTPPAGHNAENPDPEYSALCSRAAALERNLAVMEGQITAQHFRRARVDALIDRMTAQLHTIGAAIGTLEDKQADCTRWIAEMEDIRHTHMRRCDRACERLDRIVQCIQSYLEVPLRLERSAAYDASADVAAAQLIGANTQHSEKPALPDEADRQYWTDDYGKVYRAGDALIENNTFRINGYEYKTDHHGRPVGASGTLTINELGQSNRQMDDAMDVIGKGDERPVTVVDGERRGDDRGHLIGHQFNGSDRMENLVPQDWRINQQEFRQLEDHLAGQVRTDHEVQVNVVPFYGGDSRRPDGIFYFYHIDGVSNVALFPNDVPGAASEHPDSPPSVNNVPDDAAKDGDDDGELL